MLARTPRLILSVCLSLFVLAGLLGLGYIVWDPESPRDPNAVVLRIRFVDGMQGPSALGRPVPDVTVYGDGRIITVKTVHERRVMMDGRLTREAYQGLYKDARLAGLGTSRRLRSDEQISDGGVTEVEFLAKGRRHGTTVEQGAGGPRAWMIDSLVSRLHSMSDGDLVRPAVPYRPERTAIVTWRPDTTPTCTIASETEAGRPAASGNQVRFRPLLPDEKDCAAIG
jgi:hypothetical protein